MAILPVEVTERGLSRADVIGIARHRQPVQISESARRTLDRAAGVVAELVARDTPTYGISTGFGSLANTAIPLERSIELQRALLRSHAAGMGPEVEGEVVRAMLALRVRSLAMGFSGVRPVVVDSMVALLNHGYTPQVFEFGSLGASGDLAPLAHVALALTGEGHVQRPDGTLIPAVDALGAAGVEPVSLAAKEGLALINGTDGMLGMLVLAVEDIEQLVTAADIVAAMSVEALLGTDRAFAPELIEMRPHPGQAASADNLMRLLADSGIVASHRHGDDRIQDAYSLRCTPQVHGALRDTLAHATEVADRELRAAIDNPVVLPDGRVESCGNFHGAPLAYVADFLAIAIADSGALAERRTDRLLDASRSSGLPPFLTPDPGVNSGFMISQYTQAAMVAENRRHASPVSVDTIPTSAMQEDHVSLGWNACRKLRQAIDNYRRILAVELACATRALELRAPLTPAPATGAVARRVAESIAPAGPDQFLAPQLAAVERLVAVGAVHAAAVHEIGPLQ